MSGRRVRALKESFQRIMDRPAFEARWDKMGRHYPSEVRRLKKHAKRNKWLSLAHGVSIK